MANGVLTTTAGPKQIKIPLTKVVIGVGVGLIELAAIRLDQSAGRSPLSISSAQNVVPLVLTAVGIVMSIMKSASVRSIGNDLALVGGTLATLSLSRIVTSTAVSPRGSRFGRSTALRRGGGAIMASRSMPYGMSANLSSLG